MDIATRSYIRIERIDGKQVGLILDCDKGNEEELLAMLGDGLADWIVKNPDKYRTARRFTKRVLEDFYPDWVAYWLDGWKMRLVGCAALFGVLYGFAAIMQQIGA